MSRKSLSFVQQTIQVSMAEPTCFALPSGTPSPKRLRLSLKFNRQLAQDSLLTPGYCEPKHGPVSMCIDEKSEYCAVQDENLSPNCSFTQLKHSPETVVESEDRTEQPSVLGLPNCGNTCYVNSILQVLRYTPKFIYHVNLIVSYQSFLTKISVNPDVQEAKFFTKLRELFLAIRKQEAIISKNTDHAASLVKPVTSFLSSLRDMSSMFEEGEQHDAHELFLIVISTFSSVRQKVKESLSAYNNDNQRVDCSADTNMETDTPLIETVCTPNRDVKRQTKRQQKSNNIRNRAEKISKDINDVNLGFEGVLRYVITCLECEGKVKRLDEFMNIEVSIPDDLVKEGTVELIECLTPQENRLNGENKYFCDACFHSNEASMLSQIVTLPHILLLHCSWKKQSSNMIDVEKDCLKMLIPMYINTSENIIFDCHEEQVYQLYAIVLHLGNSTEVGHYVSFIKDISPASQASRIHSINERHANKDFYCDDEEMLKNFDTPVSKWMLFDDENVTIVTINESTGIFPYFDFLGITASPCMIFYCKYDSPVSA